MIAAPSRCLWLACVVALWTQGARADEFRNVRCGADIAKALIGQPSSNEPVVAIEARHRALGLKDLGGDEISDHLSSVNWRICGAEFILLIDRRNTIRDVLPLPAHSAASPAFMGTCLARGKDGPDIVVAILDGSAGTATLPAKQAWTIDQKQVRFVTASTDGLACPRTGIFTADGGR